MEDIRPTLATGRNDTSSEYKNLTFQWYDVISVLLITSIIVLSSISLSILLKYRHVLKVLRFKFIWMVLLSTISEFVFRLVYEICYHIPSLGQANFLCWAIELLTEISSIATYTWILILMMYYYTLTSQETRDPGKNCRYCGWVFGFLWPILFPVLVFPALTLAPDFNNMNSCWRGDISVIIEIFNFVMKLVFLISLIAGYVCCFYCLYNPHSHFLQLFAGVVKNIKGKTNLVALFYVVSSLSYIPIGVGVFYYKVHNTLVVSGYFVKGLITVICFCFLDSDVQNVLFPNRRKSEKISDDDMDMKNVKLDENLRRFKSEEGYPHPYAYRYADFSTAKLNAGLPYSKPDRIDQEFLTAKFDFGSPYIKPDTTDQMVLFASLTSKDIDKMKIDRV